MTSNSICINGVHFPKIGDKCFARMFIFLICFCAIPNLPAFLPTMSLEYESYSALKYSTTTRSVFCMPEACCWPPTGIPLFSLSTSASFNRHSCKTANTHIYLLFNATCADYIELPNTATNTVPQNASPSIKTLSNGI